MKRVLCAIASIVLLFACTPENQDGKPVRDKYGVDGVTPLPEAVDIGMVVDGKIIKWASFNLGAGREYEYGDYYAWGETAAKQDYSWATYAHANGQFNKLTDYCPKEQTGYWDSTVKPRGPDGETTLLPSDDVAQVKLGGKWRMPTVDELKALLELKTNKNYIWEDWALVKDARGNVVRGLRITRISTRASLFFPAAGYCEGTDLGKAAGTWGYYWSSSLSSPGPGSAFYMFLGSENSGMATLNRSNGFTVRPVTE